MTVHTEGRIIPAPLDLVFALVADVERYPEFLPLWREAEIVQRWEGGYETLQAIGLGPIRERFRTRTTLTPPERIEVQSSDPLFRIFFIRWDFSNVPRGTRIAIALQWEVESLRLQRAISFLLPGVARSMVDAFERRARRGGPLEVV